MSSRRQPERPSVFRPFWWRITGRQVGDRNETLALYRKVQELFFYSPWSGPDAVDDVLKQIYEDIHHYVDPPRSASLAAALDGALRQILAAELPVFSFPEIDWETDTLSSAELLDLRRLLQVQQRFLTNPERTTELIIRDLGNIYGGLIQALPALEEDGSAAFSVPLITLMADPADVVDRLIGTFLKDDLQEFGLFALIQRRLYGNVCAASGVSPTVAQQKPLITADVSKLPALELAETYLKGTPLLDLILVPMPFHIPDAIRFEHMHIIAGSGHGKTQTLQHLIVNDLRQDELPGMVIIDSQGDMIRKISRMAVFEKPLADRLIIIDPRDVAHPPALNMFDVNLERIRQYGAADREQILNGVIELYEYFFGSLLGAELTQKQSLIFRYLARLMIYIPAATIRTLIELMEDTRPYQSVIDGLPESARMFFTKEFADRSYIETKTQIKRRLYGIIENQTFERMFSAPRNRIDIPTALNEGKIVLVNTAKDFLKSGSSILGRYFIALTLQAALERAAVSEESRRPAYLYIDEAAEYFDNNIDNLLNQARKYKLGMVLAHQYLDQLANGLRASIASNTSIKFAGGVSDRDARSVAPDMRTTPTFILEQHKGAKETHFACYLRNLTPSAISLTVPFGTLEREPTMSDEAYKRLIENNRTRVSNIPGKPTPPPPDPDRPILNLHHPDLPWKLEGTPDDMDTKPSEW